MRNRVRRGTGLSLINKKRSTGRTVECIMKWVFKTLKQKSAEKSYEDHCMYETGAGGDESGY